MKRKGTILSSPYAPSWTLLQATCSVTLRRQPVVFYCACVCVCVCAGGGLRACVCVFDGRPFDTRRRRRDLESLVEAPRPVRIIPSVAPPPAPSPTISRCDIRSVRKVSRGRRRQKDPRRVTYTHGERHPYRTRVHSAPHTDARTAGASSLPTRTPAGPHTRARTHTRTYSEHGGLKRAQSHAWGKATRPFRISAPLT